MLIWLFFLFLVMGLVVALRRLGRGRKRPSWSWREETLFETLRWLTRRWGRHGAPHLQARVARGGVPVRWLRDKVKVSRRRAGGLELEWVTPLRVTPERTVLYLHGGGYVCCSPATHRELLARLALDARARVCAPDYRLAPEHPYPAALEDARAAYRAILADGVAPSRIVVAGDSAGGGLALALLLTLRDAGEPLPAAAVLLSPWVDLDDDQPHPAENADYDYVSAELLRVCRAAYAPSSPDDPLVSPLRGDHRGLPPLLVQVGGAEFLRGQGERLAERTRAAGVATELEIRKDMVHVGAAFASLVPEGRQAVHSLAAFIRRHTPTAEPATHAAA